MVYCANCGASVEGKFCPKCGTAIGVAPTPGAAPAGAVPVSAGGLDENIASALCYLAGLITGVLFLVLAPYNQNRTIRFHAFQSIFFHVGVIIIWMALFIVMMIFRQVPFVGALISLLFSMVFGLGVFCCWLFLMYKAYNREKFILPVIGPLAEKQA
jgi:uncharacterized membrane protein